jgi:hypothetical protein
MSLISTVVLILLVVAWGWVLGRPLLQSLLNRSHRDPVGHFNRQLSVLGQAPRHSGGMSSSTITAPSRNANKRRRLQWFMAFVIAAVVSLVLAVVFGGAFVWQHLLIDALLVGYVALAARMGALERERSAKVTNLHLVGGQNAGSPSYLRAVGER